MKAGTLEIEIVAEIAKLQDDMRKVEKSINGVERATKPANDNLKAIGATSRLSANNAQNLAFQLQDVFVGLSSGQKPMTVFIQQGAQMAGIMQQAGLGVAGLTKEVARMGASVAGKVGPAAVVFGTLALAMKGYNDELNEAANNDAFIQSLGLTADEIKKLEGVTVTYGDIALGTWDVVSAALWDVLGPAITGTRQSFMDWFNETNENGNRLANDMIGDFVGAFNAIKAVWSQLPAALGDLFFQSTNAAIRAINAMIRGATEGVNGFINAVNATVGTAIPTLSAPQIEEVANSYAGAARAAGNAWQAEMTKTERDYMGQFTGAVGEASLARSRNRLQAQADALIADRKPDKGGKDKTAKEIDEIAKAYERALKAAQAFNSALTDEITRIGKTSIEIKQMEAETAALAAEKAIVAGLTKEQAAALQAEADAIRKNVVEWERLTRAQADADFQNNVIKPLMDELALLGLVGPARELAALALEEQAFKAKATADGISDVNAAWAEYLRLRTDIINGESALEKEAEAAQRLADELNRMISALTGLGGVGSAVGALLGLASGEMGNIGGPIGDLLKMTTTGTKTDASGREVARTFGDELREIFKLDGEFGKTMTSILGGAGAGMLAGQAIFGQQSTGEAIGSAIGGAAGKALGTAFLGPIGGMVGSVIGGVLGNFVGGLIGGTPKGGVTIGNAGGALGISGTYGGSSARIDASTKSANAVIDSLSALAAELGATLDPTKGSVSIGIRKGDIRVDTSGTGQTKTSKGAIDFGEDAEAAAMFAMMDLIKDGVLVGLRAGTETLLKNAKDLATGVEKALAFEGVFKELAALKDPLAAALDDLGTEFDRLRKIFAEAGATAAEYAQLEELLALKRAEAIEQQSQALIDALADQNALEVEFLRLIGREQDALALARLNELAATKATLQPLQAMIYQLEDARAVIEQFGPLADGLKRFKEELLGGTAAGGFAFLAQQFRSTASAAAGGDATALGALQQDATAYLESARANASSELEYRRALGEVLAATDDGIFAAETAVDYAQLQIDAIAANTSVLAELKTELATYQTALVEQGEWVKSQFRRWEGDGMPIRSDAANPVYTEAAA